ncbi:porin [Ramlibacter sp.]|uniref:porin n=1 Tax=Ramlibacter sp. TaxID=1917967 RepID=UPI00260BB4B3|nr:porin [Ramlibacter sp.]MDB5955230.1 porin [Ramlibacter sp.]
MKKLIVCALACGASTLALAQSNVTIFGFVDATVGHYNVAGVQSVTKMVSGGNQASRLGFRGTEDLGGGLAAGFWIEGQFATDTGAGSGSNTNNTASGNGTGQSGFSFNRRSTVSLFTPAGELRLGRDYNPTVWQNVWWDPFLASGVASATNLAFAGTSGAGVNAMRNSNSIGYVYNSSVYVDNRVGLYGQAQYAMGEGTSGTATASDGDVVAALVGYRYGAFNGSIAYSKTKLASVRDYTQTNAGGAWDLGVVKLYGEYGIANSGMPGTRYSSYMIGAKIPLGSGYIPVALQTVSQNNAADSKANQYAIGYVYNFSIKTAIYASYARIANKSGMGLTVGNGSGLPGSPNATSSGTEIGLRTTF